MEPSWEDSSLFSAELMPGALWGLGMWAAPWFFLDLGNAEIGRSAYIRSTRVDMILSTPILLDSRNLNIQS